MSKPVNSLIYICTIIQIVTIMKAFNFDSIISLITTFDTEQKCINYLEKQRWPNRVISPYNALSKVYKCKNNQYKCKASNKFFNVRTNTMFEGINIKLRTWFLAIYLIASHKKRNFFVSISKISKCNTKDELVYITENM